MKLNTIILAAGQGKRLKTDTSKVIVELINKPLIIHLLDNLQNCLSLNDTYIIIGHCGEEVQKVVTSQFKEPKFVWQREQLGTGHAVMQVESAVKELAIPTLILAGDVPRISEELIRRFYSFHNESKSHITVLTTSLPDPAGYGRMLRSLDGQSLSGIVEHKDATPLQREIKEINSGIYLVDTQWLFKLLHKVKPNNLQKEYYLTDIIALGVKEKLTVKGFLYEKEEELRGINSRTDLALMATAIYNDTIQKHLQNGVTILSPQTTFIDPEVVIEPDVIIEPLVHLSGKTILKKGTRVQSFSRLKDYVSKENELISNNS